MLSKEDEQILNDLWEEETFIETTPRSKEFILNGIERDLELINEFNEWIEKNNHHETLICTLGVRITDHK